MEALLLRVAPGAGGEFAGATAEQIARIEELAGAELPAFYAWLLAKVGTSAGPLDRLWSPFYARNVLDAYDSGEVDVEPPSLFIGRYDDPVAPMDVFYDLTRRTANDALVVTGFNGEFTNSAETLREWLGYDVVTAFRINRSPQRCRGMLEVDDGDVSAILEPLLGTLDFRSAVPHGRFSGAYERADAALVYKIEVEDDSANVRGFAMGGPNDAAVRRILGEIRNAGIEVTVRTWSPPLPRP
jgi:hypothetical protein